MRTRGEGGAVGLDVEGHAVAEDEEAEEDRGDAAIIILHYIILYYIILYYIILYYIISIIIGGGSKAAAVIIMSSSGVLPAAAVAEGEEAERPRSRTICNFTTI